MSGSVRLESLTYTVADPYDIAIRPEQTGTHDRTGSFLAPAPTLLSRRCGRGEPHAVGAPARREGLLRHGAAPGRIPRDALHDQPRAQPRPATAAIHRPGPK